MTTNQEASMKHVDEAVDTILARGHPDWPLVRQAITTAVEVEREGCARVAHEAEDHYDSLGGDEYGEWIAKLIRARGEGVKRD